MVSVSFEPDYKQKILVMTFQPGSEIARLEDLQAWREQWLGALKSWHTPYKVVLDCSGLRVQLAAGVAPEELKKSCDRMLAFFRGLFLRKIEAFGHDAEKGHDLLPLTFHSSKDEAYAAAGLRQERASASGEDFRALLRFENHFREKFIELTPQGDVVLDTPEKIVIFKQKLTNQLMQWHSGWHLVVDCSCFEIPAAMFGEVEKVFKFFRGFFLKAVIGYQPKLNKEQYPFSVFRTRHLALMKLESPDTLKAEAADCNSRK